MLTIKPSATKSSLEGQNVCLLLSDGHSQVNKLAEISSGSLDSGVFTVH